MKEMMTWLMALTFVGGVASVSCSQETAKEAPKTSPPAVAAAATSAKASAAGTDGKVALKIDLPVAMFTGTPKDLKTPFLEPPRPPGARPVFYAPAGVTNVAAKKKVTASDSEPVIGTLDLVTDSDKEGTDGSYVEFGPGKQWVQIDLGQQYAIYAVVVWHYHSEGRVYRGVVAQVSDDPDFIQNVQTIFNNDQNNSLGLGAGKDYEYIETNEGRLIDAKGVKGRYVRLYSKGNTSNEMNHYTEVDVYGKAP
jgi:hypothetical protein